MMQATFEPGLPGTGPLPIHLHTGHPTPWSEGCVVRFEANDGSTWIGNLQTGDAYPNEKIVIWESAKAIIVILHGAVYFVRPDVPQEWKLIDVLGIDCALTTSEDIALVSTYTDLHALHPDGSQLWRRTVAVDGVEIHRIDGETVFGIACMDSPDDWRRFSLSLRDGSDSDASDAMADLV